MTSNPLALIAEITHRCPLHCVYCSNPLQMMGTEAELPTEEWIRVLREAARLGVRALLVEQRYFAWGASSRSSKRS